MKIADTKPSVAEGPRAKPFRLGAAAARQLEDDVSSGFDAAFEEVALQYVGLTASTLRRLHRAASKVSPRPSLLATASNLGSPGRRRPRSSGEPRRIPRKAETEEALLAVRAVRNAHADRWTWRRRADAKYLKELANEMRCGSGPGGFFRPLPRVLQAPRRGGGSAADGGSSRRRPEGRRRPPVDDPQRQRPRVQSVLRIVGLTWHAVVAWTGSDDEERRVLYVGVTRRARALAAPVRAPAAAPRFRNRAGRWPGALGADACAFLDDLKALPWGEDGAMQSGGGGGGGGTTGGVGARVRRYLNGSRRRWRRRTRRGSRTGRRSRSP